MAVLNPLKLTILNYPEDQVEELEAINNPEDLAAGVRKVPFSRTLYIEQDDFRTEPPPKYHRLFPGNEIRLRYAYFIKCVDFRKDEQGNVIEVLCTYDPTTRGGDAPDGRKVKSTIHWLSAPHALTAEVRLYDRLFKRPDPENLSEEDESFIDNLNPELAHRPLRCPPRTEPEQRQVWSPLSIRAPGLLLCRPRFNQRSVSLQPHGCPQRYLGEDRKDPGLAAGSISLKIG